MLRIHLQETNNITVGYCQDCLETALGTVTKY